MTTGGIDMIGSVGSRIAAAGILAGFLMGTAPAMAQELQIAPLDRKALTAQGFADPSLALILNSTGELIGALTEDHPNQPSTGPRKLAPARLPESISKIQGFGSIAILAYQGSNCYIVRRPDGTLYVMPPGCV
jgi:hypothetical protein